MSIPLTRDIGKVNHATHHRSEIAAMITLISNSPPDTGINTYRTAIVKG